MISDEYDLKKSTEKYTRQGNKNETKTNRDWGNSEDKQNTIPTLSESDSLISAQVLVKIADCRFLSPITDYVGFYSHKRPHSSFLVMKKIIFQTKKQSS